MTEFANVWVQQGSGSRLIRLIPSPSCRHFCSMTEIRLDAGDVLYYNWQFWNPISVSVVQQQPLKLQESSLTYVGSFY